eukprot:6191804-Pleurochrysis_carterae.AAC.2
MIRRVCAHTWAQFFDINNASDPLGATWLDMTFTSPHVRLTNCKLRQKRVVAMVGLARSDLTHLPSLLYSVSHLRNKVVFGSSFSKLF